MHLFISTIEYWSSEMLTYLFISTKESCHSELLSYKIIYIHLKCEHEISDLEDHHVLINIYFISFFSDKYSMHNVDHLRILNKPNSGRQPFSLELSKIKGYS